MSNTVASLNLARHLTISTWISPTESSSGGLIIYKGGEYGLARSSEGNLIWVFSNSVPRIWIDTGIPIPTNAWTHIAVVNDSGTVTTFKNGNPVHTYDGSGNIDGFVIRNNRLCIGGSENSEDGEGEIFFKGLIDEVKIHDYVLQMEEVSSLVSTPPDVSGAGPSVATIGPPTNQMVQVSILGVTDPDGDPFTINITGIVSDENPGIQGGSGVGTPIALV